MKKNVHADEKKIHADERKTYVLTKKSYLHKQPNIPTDKKIKRSYRRKKKRSCI